MRGSAFYKESILAVRDNDRSYIVHRDMLNKIKLRQKSNMLDAQGLRAIEVRSAASGTRTSMKGSKLDRTQMRLSQ